NRLRNSLRAALSLAAEHDPRIGTGHAWKVGLPALADAQQARNVVLDDDTVRAFVAAAHRHSRALGLMIETLAVSGTRPSQASRLLVADLKADDPAAPKLMMPKSAKGGTSNRLARKAERFSVPITAALATLLAEAARGRSPDDYLLIRDDGGSWGYNAANKYRKDVRAIVASIGLDPDEVTAYS